MKTHRRHDILDRLWEKLEPHLPGRKGSVGRPANNSRWRDKKIWEELLEIVTGETDYEWLMIDASHIKVHPHAAGARGGNQDMSRTKGG